MSPGECYLMQLSAKITHSSLSELVIAIYRRTGTMKKMGLGNLNWTPNPPGESFNAHALLHTPSEPSSPTPAPPPSRRSSPGTRRTSGCVAMRTQCRSYKSWLNRKLKE